jgi:hypothetical protein
MLKKWADRGVPVVPHHPEVLAVTCGMRDLRKQECFGYALKWMTQSIEIGSGGGNPLEKLKAYYAKTDIKIDVAVKQLDKLRRQFEALNRIQDLHHERIRDLQGYVDLTDFAFYLADPIASAGGEYYGPSEVSGLLAEKVIPQVIEHLKACDVEAKKKGSPQPQVGSGSVILVQQRKIIAMRAAAL